MTARHIIAMGGGGFSMEPKDLALDHYVLSQAGVSHPKICFLPTATGDAESYILNFYKAFSTLECRPSYLSLFRLPTADLDGYLLDHHILYVGGGNTRSMLALWREWEVDSILHKAYKAGVILAGVSAGANCWFQQCLTDSVPREFRMLPGLDFLQGSFCLHYDGEPERKPTFYQLLLDGAILPGYAVDNRAALHFINEHLSCAVSSQSSATVHHLSTVQGHIVEEAVEVTCLGVEFGETI